MQVVKLLGVSIDEKLSFNMHISSSCKQASAQLNAIMRLGALLGFKEKKSPIESLVLYNNCYCPLFWHFVV